MSAPAQHVADSWQSAEFYANKVLMEARGAGGGASEPNHMWIKALKVCDATLQSSAALRSSANQNKLMKPSDGPTMLP